MALLVTACRLQLIGIKRQSRADPLLTNDALYQLSDGGNGARLTAEWLPRKAESERGLAVVQMLCSVPV